MSNDEKIMNFITIILVFYFHKKVYIYYNFYCFCSEIDTFYTNSIETTEIENKLLLKRM